MNRIHKLIWSKTQNRLVVVGEGVRGHRGKKSQRRKLAASLAATTLLASPAWAELPTGGQIVAGSGSIATSGADMTVHQASRKMIANWQSFSIGAGNSVTFVQPNASAVALNRVTGHNTSHILGNLNANGQVFLVNPNGVVIGNGAQVRTGGFVASTLDVSDADFLAGHYRFEGVGGEIENLGNIEGKVVALIAPTVRNEGTIKGDAALAAGTDVLLDFDGDGLLSVEVKASTLQTLVENKGLIQADGGVAILTARGASEAMKGVVNNSGRIEAQTLAGRNGRILLLADMQHGEVIQNGVLDASAPNDGDGGFVETSAAKVRIGETARVTTRAAQGQTGTWLIDPSDYTIAAGGGDITGAQLSANLADNNIEIQSSAGTTTGNGDIHVNDAVSWNENTLTLTAARDININAVMTAGGSSRLVMNTGTANGGDDAVAGGTVKVGFAPGEAGGFAGRVDFPSRSGEGFLTINGDNYYVLGADDLGVEGDTSTTTLQGIGNNLNGRYALGADIDASATAGWDSGAGFMPIGSSSNHFTGDFDGLGHTITNLSINRPGRENVGLFGRATNAALRNIGLVNAAVTGKTSVGSLAGTIDATGDGSAAVTNAYATGKVDGVDSRIGGLVGYHSSGGPATMTNVYTAVDVTGSRMVGGLVGYNYGYNTTITSAYATGSVTGSDYAAGGLAGYHEEGHITDAYAKGDVTGNRGVGGLVGVSAAASKLRRTYASGSVSGNENPGGLVGLNFGGSINSSFWDTEASGIGVSAGGGGRTTAAMKDPFTFINAGWDFDTVWAKSNSGENGGQMMLQSMHPGSYYDGYVHVEGDLSHEYGKTNPDLSGLDITKAGAVDTIDWNITATVNVGNYAWGDLNAGPDNIYWDGIGNLEVTPAPLTVTVNDDSKTYDGVAHGGGNGVTYSGFVNGEDESVLGGVLAYGGSAQGAIDVGTYVISVSGLTATNYSIDYAGGTLIITPASLTVTANDVSKTYDGTSYSGGSGVTYSGFVNGEDESVLGGALAYGGSAQGATLPGSYTISISGLTAGNNYVLNYVDGQLTIEPVTTTHERDHHLPTSPTLDDTDDITILADAPALIQTEALAPSDNPTPPCLASGRIMAGAACGNQ